MRTKTTLNNDVFMLGYDYLLFNRQGIKIPIYAPIDSHLCVVGGSGSGKSTAVLYWLYKLKKFNADLYIVDFKKSGEFKGITPHFGEFENSYEIIKDFYMEFLNTCEGGSDQIKILLIDEIAGLRRSREHIEEIRFLFSHHSPSNLRSLPRNTSLGTAPRAFIMSCVIGMGFSSNEGNFIS